MGDGVYGKLLAWTLECYHELVVTQDKNRTKWVKESSEKLDELNKECQ